MLCLISSRRGQLTHLARSTVLYAAESGSDKLDIWNVSPLPRPVSLASLGRRMEGRQAWRGRRALGGGHIPAAALAVILDALRRLDADGHEAALKLVDRDGEPSDVEPSRTEINWAFQRDATLTALEIARIPKRPIPAKPPSDRSATAVSMLDSDEDMISIEDLLILQDLDAPGDDWDFLKRQRYPAKTYINGDTKLTVVLANKLELERQIGVDLVYVNETFNAVVFVQYKMFSGADGEEGYRPDGQLKKEIARMDAAAAELAKLPTDESCDGFRIAADPFFLKFCSKLVPADERGHVPGIYVPLSFWKRLVITPAARGSRGGTIVFDDTFGRRRLTPTNFVDLVGRGWIGTSARQTKALTSYLRAAVHGDRGIVLAVQSQVPDDDAEAELPAPRPPAPKKERYPGRPPRKRKVWQP